jgi:hypothetical protein
MSQQIPFPEIAVGARCPEVRKFGAAALREGHDMIQVQHQTYVCRRRSAACYTAKSVSPHDLKPHTHRRLTNGRTACARLERREFTDAALAVDKRAHCCEPTSKSPNVRVVSKPADRWGHFAPARLTAQRNPSCAEVVEQLVVRDIPARII